jgi:hypothetical protein
MSDLKTVIKEAGSKLKASNDADWTEGGRPSLKRIQALAKSNAITQDQVDDALPDLTRASLTPEKKPAEQVPQPGRSRPQTAALRALRMGEDGKTDRQRAEEAGHKWLDGVLVVAVERGFYGGLIRDPGEPPFPYTGPDGSWFRELSTKERRRIEADAEDDD